MGPGVASADRAARRPADLPVAYIANDRRMALATGSDLPERTTGAGLFADVSGFVATSARLAAEFGAQRGAEELTRLLDRAIGAAIDEVRRASGSVVYFSGDAITCWFDGEAGTLHAARAAQAAVRAVETAGRLVTPAGYAIALQLKCAVAAGPVRRFVVGDPAEQLIDVLAGDLLDELAAVEQVASPGEVLLADSARARLGEEARYADTRPLAGGRPGSASLLTELTGALAAPLPPPGEDIDLDLDDDVVRPWLLPVVYERLRAGRGEFVAELRSAVPVFIRFPGFDFDHDEQAPAGLHAFVELTQEVFAGHGGNVLQLTLGDKGAYLYAVLGSPVAHGDDPSRAVAAAAELLAAAARMGVHDVQIGLTYGRVRSGTYGHEGRRTFVCLGPPVNLAARLMSGAPSGQIHASAELVEATRRQFRWHPVGTRAVKGFDEPVEVFAFDGVDEADEAQDDTLVGRDDELAVLAEAVARAESGLGAVVAVQGEPGHGKSRLVHEATRAAEHRGIRIATGVSATTNRRGSFLVWRGVTRGLLASVAGVATPTSLGPGALPAEPASDLPVEPTVELVSEPARPTVSTLPAGSAAVPGPATPAGPAASLREGDDAELLAALRVLLPEQVDRFPLLGPLLGLDLPETAVTTSMDAKLRKTSREDLVIRLVHAVAARAPVVLVLEDVDRADPLSRDLLEAVAAASTQEPVAIVLTLRPTAEEADGLAVAGLPWFRSVPVSALGGADAGALVVDRLRAAYGTAFEPAPALVAGLRERAQGNPFFIEQLVGYLATAGVDPTDGSPRALWRRLELPGSLHSLVLEKLDTLAEDPRRTVKVASVVGRHFDRDLVRTAYPDLGSQLTTEASLRAASRVELVEPDREAPSEHSPWRFQHNLVQEATYESVPFELRTQLHGQVAAALEARDPDPTGAELDLVTHHWWHSDNVGKQVDYLARAADAAQARYANDTALEYYQRLASLRTGVDRAAALRGIGQVLELTGAWEEARAAYVEAISLTERDPSLRAWCETQLADVARRQGQFEEAASCLDRAAEGFAAIDEESGRAQVFHLRGTLAAQQGLYAQARESYETSLALRPEGSDDRARAATLSNLGVVAEYEGDLVGARRYHERSLALREKLGDLWAIAVSRTGLGMISMLEHRPQEARAEFEEAMRLNQTVGDAWMVAISHNNLGNADRDLARYDEALRHYAAAGARYVASEDLWSLAFLLEDAAICRAEQGQAQVAGELLGAADTCRRELGSPRPDSLENELRTRLSGVRDRLGPSSWDEAREYGRTLTPSEAVTLLA